MGKGLEQTSLRRWCVSQEVREDPCWGFQGRCSRQRGWRSWRTSFHGVSEEGGVRRWSQEGRRAGEVATQQADLVGPLRGPSLGPKLRSEAIRGSHPRVRDLHFTRVTRQLW